MPAQIKTFISAILGVVFLVVFSSNAWAQVKINEFSSGTTSDWVEIYNLSPTEPIDLASYRLRDSTGSNKKDLSGSLTPGAFLAFSFSNYLNKDGDLVKLIKILEDETEEAVDQIGYGDSGDICTADATQSIGRSPDGTGSFVRFASQTKETPNTASEAPCPSPIPSPSPSPSPEPESEPESEPDPSPSPSPTPTSVVVASPKVSPKTSTKKPVTTSLFDSHDSEEMLLSTENGEILGSTEGGEATESKKEKSPYLIPIILGVLGLGLIGGTGVVFYKQRGYNGKHEEDGEI